MTTIPEGASGGTPPMNRKQFESDGVHDAFMILLSANPQYDDRILLDVDHIVGDWELSLRTVFGDSITAEMLQRAAYRAAVMHPGIRLWGIAEELRQIHPHWFRNGDGSWAYETPRSGMFAR